LIHGGYSKTIPIPSHVVPCLHVLPTGVMLAVIVDEPRIPSIVKIDARGSVIFRKPSIEHGKDYPHFTRIMPAADGQVFMLGGLRGRPVIWKIDEQGETLFEKEIVMEGAGICSDGVRLSDNRFRICGVSRNGDGARSWIVDVDGHGEIQREFVFDDAPWTSFPQNLRIVNLESNRTAFLHPVTIEKKTYCYLTVLDDVLKPIAEIQLCEVPDFVGTFQVQRHNTGLVIGAVGLGGKISLYLLDEDLQVEAVGDTKDLSVGGASVYRLAVSEGRVLVLTQGGAPMVRNSNALGCAVFDLEKLRGAAPRR